MVAYTKDHAKAGTTEFIATVYTLVEDEDGLIDSGGKSYREDAEHSPAYKTLRGAVNWVKRQRGDHADIYQYDWSEYTFHDEEYGKVFDADVEYEGVMYLWMDEGEWKEESVV